MKWFIYLIVAITYSCSSHKSPIYVEIAHDITEKTAKKLDTEKELHLIGTGGGMMHNVRMMAMSFRYHHPINIDQGRELLMSAVNEYLLAINSNEQIRPYLVSDPFEPKNVEIAIFISNPDGSPVAKGDICVISENQGILQYDTRDPKTNHLTKIHEESYEQALQKLDLH